MRFLLKPGHRYFLLLIVAQLFMFPQLNIGQIDSGKVEFKAIQLLKLAKRCESKGDYVTALEYMQEYYAKRKDNPKSVYYLANLYYKSKQYDSAIVYYSKELIVDDKKFPLRKFHLGSLLMIKQDYEDARETLSEFRRKYDNKKDSRSFRKIARNLIIGCDSAIKADSNQLTAYIYNLGNEVNTKHIEFSPFPISKDKIIYGSLPIDTANVFNYSKNNAPVRQLQIAEKKGKTWQSTGTPNWNINHPDFNTGNASLSNDGQRLYFTRCYKNWKFKTICHIYKIEKVGKNWSEPVKLSNNINTENYTSTQPAVGTNPKNGSDILYFVSDRTGGKGGLDLWCSIYDKRRNTFKPPKNLGSKINTFGDEITPYFNTAAQTL